MSKTPISDEFIIYASKILDNEIVYKKLARALSKRLYNYLTIHRNKAVAISKQRLKFGKGEYGDTIFSKPLVELAKMEHEEILDFMIYSLIEVYQKKYLKKEQTELSQGF